MKKSLKVNDINIAIVTMLRNCQMYFGGSFFIVISLIPTVFTFLLLSGQHLSANQPVNKLNNNAFNHILHLRFSDASGSIRNAKKIEINNPYTIYLENYQEFIKCLLDGNLTSYKIYKHHFNQRIESIRKNNPDISSIRYQAEMNFQTFILAGFHNENLIALKHFLLSSRQINHFISKNQNAVSGYKLKGLILVLLSAIPEEFSRITSLIGINSNLNDGIKMLEDYSVSCRQNPDEYMESYILLSFMRYFFSRQYMENFEIMQAMPPSFLENSLFRFIYLLSSARAGQTDEVLAILNRYSQRETEFRICFFEYLRGEALLNQLDNGARNYLQNFISCSGNGIYEKSAGRKLAWSYLIDEDTISYYKYRKLVLKTGSIKAEADRQAFDEFTFQEMPNVDLIKARLLFDGGYYTRAKTLLLNKEVRERLRDVYQQIEYSYRLARIYHMTNEIDKAIKLYRITLENGWNYPLYYATYSALQLGYIYEKIDDSANAKAFYHKVLESKENSYDYRFRYEAKEGLKRLIN